MKISEEFKNYAAEIKKGGLSLYDLDNMDGRYKITMTQEIYKKSGRKYYEVFMSQGYQEYSGYAKGKTLSVWGTVKGTSRYVVKSYGKRNKKMTVPSIKSRYDKLS